MKLLDWLIRWTWVISRFSMWVVGCFLLFTVFLVGSEVVLRKFGSAWVHGASEVGGYMLAVCSAWAYSFTLLSRSNIRFDAVYTQSSSRLRAFLDVLGLVCLGVFIVIVTYYSSKVLQTSIQLRSHSTGSLSVPLWIPQTAWISGFMFFCWTILLLSLRALVAFLLWDYGTVFQLAGLGYDEEIKRETEQVEIAIQPTERPMEAKN